MLKHRNIVKSTAEYTRTYDQFHGIGSEFDKDNPIRHIENMFKNRFFGDGEVLESVPGYRKIRNLGGRINGIHLQPLPEGRANMYIHAGSELYRTSRYNYSSLDPLYKVCDIADFQSSAFSMGTNLYILDGQSIIELDEEGAATKVTPEDLNIGYIPTTYINGEPYEKINLLSPRFRESFYVHSADDISLGTQTLVYSVTDEERGVCSVTGCGEIEEGSVYIPKYTTINGKKYLVNEIAPGAFLGNTEIHSLYTSMGLEKIGSKAFMGATNLTDISLSNTVKYIGSHCFYGCTSLIFLYLGSGIEEFAESCFSSCTSIESIAYQGTEEMFYQIANCEIFDEYEIRFEAMDDSISVAIPIMTPTYEIEEVLIDGDTADYYYSMNTGEIILYFDNKAEIIGKTVLIDGYHTASDGFLSTDKGLRMEAARAVLGCTVCQSFDGRIFLSGNPYLGGTVFYSELTGDGQTNPLYFSVDSYFIDGTDEIAVRGLAEIAGSLAVLKSFDCDQSDIFFHKPKGSGKSKTYPESASSCRLSPTGACFRFYDELIFMTRSGLYSLSGASASSARCISTPINHLLLKEDLSLLRLGAWGSYLVCSAGNSIYLADAFPKLNGETKDYEWYYLSGIGSYEDDYQVYRYSDVPIDGMAPSEKAEQVCTEEVYSYVNEDGDTIYYSTENGVDYPLYTVGERAGGELYAISAIKCSANLLLFGCDNGDFCVFNNDMAGALPEIAYQDKPDFDHDAYYEEAVMSIHPYYYSFEGHAPRCAVITVEDDCGVDYLEKTTIPRSTVLRLKSFPDSSVSFRVVTGEKQNVDFSPINISKTNFEDADFSSFLGNSNPKVTVTVDDRSRGWIQKQLALVSEKPYSPFGVYSMSYRYKIKSTIKNKSL